LLLGSKHLFGVTPVLKTPVGHTHALSTQILPDVALLQFVPALAPEQAPLAPQYILSVSGTMHLPPQRTWLLKQPVAHVVPLQNCPEGQLVPALVAVAPQFELLLGFKHLA